MVVCPVAPRINMRSNRWTESVRRERQDSGTVSPLAEHGRGRCLMGTVWENEKVLETEAGDAYPMV